MLPTILFATTNGHKIRLFKMAWQTLGLNEKFNLVTLKDLPEKDLGHIAEDSGTFGGDALLKAKAYAEAYNLPTISQDRGFVFEALNWPGTLSKEVMFGDEKVIHTKQMWEEQRGENYNRAVSVLTKLDRQENRRIQIIQGLAIALPNGNFQTEEKKSYGIASQQVINGVGGSYDWFFIHQGLEITNSQFPSEEALDIYAAKNYYSITPKIVRFLEGLK
jgi:XTP/dITP diphosphohydrolase